MRVRVYIRHEVNSVKLDYQQFWRHDVLMDFSCAHCRTPENWFGTLPAESLLPATDICRFWPWREWRRTAKRPIRLPIAVNRHLPVTCLRDFSEIRYQSLIIHSSPRVIANIPPRRSQFLDSTRAILHFSERAFNPFVFITELSVIPVSSVRRSARDIWHLFCQYRNVIFYEALSARFKIFLTQKYECEKWTNSTRVIDKIIFKLSVFY